MKMARTCITILRRAHGPTLFCRYGGKRAAFARHFGTTVRYRAGDADADPDVERGAHQKQADKHLADNHACRTKIMPHHERVKLNTTPVHYTADGKWRSAPVAAEEKDLNQLTQKPRLDTCIGEGSAHRMRNSTPAYDKKARYIAGRRNSAEEAQVSREAANRRGPTVGR